MIVERLVDGGGEDRNVRMGFRQSVDSLGRGQQGH